MAGYHQQNFMNPTYTERQGQFLAGKRAVTADTGLRLFRFFGTSDAFWGGLLTDYDTAQAKDALADVLSRIHRYEPVHI